LLVSLAVISFTLVGGTDSGELSGIITTTLISEILAGEKAELTRPVPNFEPLQITGLFLPY